MLDCPVGILLPADVLELDWSNPIEAQEWSRIKNQNVVDNYEALNSCAVQHRILVQWIKALTCE